MGAHQLDPDHPLMFGEVTPEDISRVDLGALVLLAILVLDVLWEWIRGLSR